MPGTAVMVVLVRAGSAACSASAAARIVVRIGVL
jgi:hypothetical protein